MRSVLGSRAGSARTLRAPRRTATVVLAGLGLLAGPGLLAGCTGGPVAGAAQPTEPPPTSLTSPTARRPASATPAPTGTPVYVFPVHSEAARFGRVHHDYPATDIFAPCGTEARAVTDAVVDEVSRKDTWTARENGGATRGGLSVSIIGTDGVRYYGSHLKSIRPEIVRGARVRAGAVLGLVGHTGSARPTPCHLHFGISPPCADRDWWTRRGVLPPYRFLTSWQAGGQRSPVSTVAAWRSDHGCPTSAPAGGSD